MQIKLTALNMPLLGALVANGAGHAYFVVTFPAIAREFEIPDLITSVIMSVSVVALIFTAPIWGSFSDKSGRQRILTLSLFGAGIATIMTGVLLSYIELFTAVTFGYCLLAIRISHGIVSSGLKPVTQATAADVSTPANRLSTMALIGATFGLGSILGGSLAVISGSQYILLGYFVIGLVMLLTAIFFNGSFEETQPIRRHEITKISLKPVWFNLFSTVMALMTYSTLQLMTNWYLKDVFLLSHDKAIRFAGLTMTLSMLAMIATQAWLYVKQTNARNSRLIGLLLLGIGLSLSAFSDALPYFLTSMTLVGIGFGLFLPANITLMSLQVPKEQQGLLGGANGLCQGIGLASGPLAASLLYQITPQLPFAIFASIFILMLGLIRLS